LLSQIPHCPPDDDAGAQQGGQWETPRARGSADPPRPRGSAGPPPERGRPSRPSDRFPDGSRRDRPESR
jgi:hypothetical protein